jgi:hypothetical protein
MVTGRWDTVFGIWSRKSVFGSHEQLKKYWEAVNDPCAKDVGNEES